MSSEEEEDFDGDRRGGVGWDGLEGSDMYKIDPVNEDEELTARSAVPFPAT